MHSRWWLAAVAGLVLTAGELSAQWFTYPNPAVPRTADGKPNLAAPAPRTADGKPDFSGVWLAGNHLPCPPLLRDELGNCIEKIPLSRETRDIGAGVKGGLPHQPWAAALVKQRVADNAKDDPHARCMPSSVPRVWSLPHYNKVVQVPGLLLVLNEFNASYRQIFTDARPLPPDPNPSWTGYSSARWEGDTLVVDTIGFRDDLWLDMAGNTLTSAARMRERIRRPAFGRLEIELTIDDPKAYTRPWTVTIPMDHAIDVELLEEMCLENEKFGPKMDGK
jgi:hypothetical protein